MPIQDIEMLYSRAVDIMVLADLTPAERSEVMNIAQGFDCKDSATAEGVSTETIRACRKRIYEKLGALHAGTLMSTLETLAGVASGGPESRARAGG
jgi:DNA-binding CsgD family transcriptional regulator